jgi:hypothetical protein
MPGHGPAPKPPGQRRGHSAPVRGEWRAVPGVGWQHGPIPPAPQGLTDESDAAWAAWMRSWVAAHWTEGDLPGLRITIQLHDQVQRGKYQRAGELRLWANGYGITPSGQQDRRWAPPEPVDAPEAVSTPPAGRYSHLRPLPDEAGRKNGRPKVAGESARGPAGKSLRARVGTPGTDQAHLDAVNARLRDPEGDAS